MDSHDRRSRQSNVSSFTGSSSTGNAESALLQHNPTGQATGQYPTVSGPGDRYQVRDATGHLPAVASSARGSHLPSYQYQTNTASGYGDIATGQAMQATPLQYSATAGTDYAAAQDSSQRTQQQSSQHQNPQTPQQSHHQSQQQYHNLYGQQPSPSSPYESVSHYPPRQSAAIEVLSNQFAGVPQQYYVAGETGPTSAPNTGLSSQGVQQQYSQMSYNPTQSPVARDALHPNYGAGITDTNQVSASTQQSYGQAINYTPTHAADLDSAFHQYEEALRRTFEATRDGDLHEAGITIVSLTEWLLGNAESLGLIRDDETAHATRLKLWGEFNICWISLLQRQKDLTMEMLDTGQRPAQSQSLLEYEQMETMGNELIRLCDNMEKHGLVDYQMGVWEEDITTLLIACLDILDEQAGSSALRRS